MRRKPYELRRLGWGTFTLEAEIVLKAPYTWVGHTSGTTQRGLKLTWTLDFTDRGRQGRVRRGVRRLEEEGGRRLRTRPLRTVTPDADEEEDEDEDYEDEGEDDDLSEEEEEGDVSEFVETPRRR